MFTVIYKIGARSEAYGPFENEGETMKWVVGKQKEGWVGQFTLQFLAPPPPILESWKLFAVQLQDGKETLLFVVGKNENEVRNLLQQLMLRNFDFEIREPIGAAFYASSQAFVVDKEKLTWSS